MNNDPLREAKGPARRRWRLIFRLSGEKAEVIRVEEVNKHYGD